MIAVITGDIIDSARTPIQKWMPMLKSFLTSLGEESEDWEIYRGDEVQLRIAPELALRTAVRLKALLRQQKGLDIRLAIGLGGEDYHALRVGESNGSAYLNSGHAFDSLRSDGVRLRTASGVDAADRGMNLILELALHIMDNWTRASAQVVALILEKPDTSQEELAIELGIRQSAVSQRQSRARMDLILKTLNYYSESYLSLL